MNRFCISLLLLLSGVGCISAQETTEAPAAYLVGEAHLDTQWNWDLVTTIGEYLPNTMRQNLFLLERYPNYIFNFEGGIKYSWMKEYYPELYQLVRKQIAAGRWHVAGASWEANEVLVSSSESLIRNILLGQTFYRREFGLSSTDIFLPDCFGFPFNLPTIAAHCGLIGFSTQKLQWRGSWLTDAGQYPFTFGIWEGVDGSRIAAAANAFDYSRAWLPDEDLAQSGELYEKAMRSPARAVYHYFGTGDIGGSPTIASAEAVDRAVGRDGKVSIISAESDRMFRDFMPLSAHPYLPVYCGEMPMDVHGNACYTSQAALKLYNRENERLAAAAERAAVMADYLLPGSYPAADLTTSWKRFIFHQFHDDLTGTSIPRAYEFSWNDELISLKRFSQSLTSAVATISRALDTRVKGTPVILYNPTSHRVDDVVAISLPAKKGHNKWVVYDENNKEVASQILRSSADSTILLVHASLPPMSASAYDIRINYTNKIVQAPLKATPRTLENEIYRLALNDKGDLISWYDKRSDRELIAQGDAIAPQLFTNNDSFDWPAWEIKRHVIDSQPSGLFSCDDIALVEQGDLRATLRVTRSYGETRWVQYISLVAGSDRIDVQNEIDWHATRALLKMKFPLAIANDSANYDIGIGSINRPTNNDRAYEVYAHRRATFTDASGDYGVSILSDSKYGWDKPDDHTLRLTLMHTPAAESAFYYQSEQDLGYHTFGYALVAHAGNEVEGNMACKAESYDNGIMAFLPDKHKGFLGRSFSWLNIDAPNLEVMALKQAEDGNGYILRLCEKHGLPVDAATISFAAPLQAAYRCDGTEIVQENIPYYENSISISMPAHGVATYRILMQPCATPLAPLKQQAIELPYNLRCVSYNEFRNTADFDGMGCSYAAELLPDTLVVDGIVYPLGDKNSYNGVKCLGDTLLLPQDAPYNRLYLLAAATVDDYRATLHIDGKPYDWKVPSYTGFIGQWGHTGHTVGYLKHPDIAYVGTHRHDLNGNRDRIYEFTYLFRYAIDLPRGARQVVLPHNSRIVLFAATVVCEETMITPATPLFRTAIKGENVTYKEFETRNLLLGKEVVASSGATGDHEAARYAIDGNEHTKWADYHRGKPNYIEVDLGAVTEVKAWRVKHAGEETLAFVTRNYALQVRDSLDEPWHTVDVVEQNTKNITDRNLAAPVMARYVRLHITTPVRDGGNIARIYEWEVY